MGELRVLNTLMPNENANSAVKQFMLCVYYSYFYRYYPGMRRWGFSFEHAHCTYAFSNFCLALRFPLSFFFSPLSFFLSSPPLPHAPLSSFFSPPAGGRGVGGGGDGILTEMFALFLCYYRPRWRETGFILGIFFLARSRDIRVAGRLTLLTKKKAEKPASRRGKTCVNVNSTTEHTVDFEAHASALNRAV